jgi:hypothetical protein
LKYNLGDAREVIKSDSRICKLIPSLAGRLNVYIWETTSSVELMQTNEEIESAETVARTVPWSKELHENSSSLPEEKES